MEGTILIVSDIPINAPGISEYLAARDLGTFEVICTDNRGAAASPGGIMISEETVVHDAFEALLAALEGQDKIS